MILETNLPALPPGWARARLDQLADIVGGVTKDAKRQRDPSFVEVPYLRVANVQRGFLDLSKVETIRVPADKATSLRLRSGDVLFTEGGDRDKLGRGWVWEGQIEDCIHQNHVFRARLLTEELEPKLISWYGNTFGQAWFEAAGKQTTNLASISLTALKSFSIPIPPVAEQQRIVAEAERQLSKVDAGADALRRARRNLRHMRTIVLNEAVLGHLVPQNPDDEPAESLIARLLDHSGTLWTEFPLMWEQGRSENDPLPLPRGWTRVPLGMLLREPLRNGHSARTTSDGAGIRTLTLTAVTKADFSEANTKITRADADRVRDLWIKNGDILIQRANTPELVGTAAMYRGSEDFAIFPDLLIRIRLREEILPSFVEIVLRCGFARRYFRAAARGLAGSMPKIQQSHVERFLVPLPPATEQRTIVAEVERQLSLIEAAEREVERGLEKAVSLRRAILQAAFEGRLVPRNPADEPAAVLLERIAAARTSRIREPRDRSEQGTLL